MQAMLYGVRRVDMQDDRGNVVRGFSCFIGYSAPGVIGFETQKVFVNDDLAAECAWSPSAGKLVNVDFTPKGKVCGISNVDEQVELTQGGSGKK